MEREQTYEQAVARLEQIVKQLESGEGSLNEMIRLYQEGMELHARCTEMLDGFEKKLTTLRADTVEGE